MSLTNILGVLLECAAVAAALSVGVAMLSLALVSIAGGLSASARADVAFVAAVMPAVVIVIALVATLAPSALATFGIAAADHCPQHLHHPHLCVVHFGGLRPAAAVLGSFTLAVFIVRSAGVAARHVRMSQAIAQLERLGEVEQRGAFPLVSLPGVPRVCHAVGMVRRRVLVSSALVEGLSPRAWSAVHAHEQEHLRRRDPLAMIVVEVALLFVPPFISGALGAAFRRSAEAACDGAAAREVGDAVAVAEGLLEAARIFGPAPGSLGAPAATEISLEERVRDLLDGHPSAARRSLGFAGAMGLTAVFAVLGVSHEDTVHHALETLLSYLS